MSHKPSTRKNVRRFRTGPVVERRRAAHARHQAEAQARVRPPRVRAPRERRDPEVVAERHEKGTSILRDLFGNALKPVRGWGRQ